jgi:hypothetical protein
MRRWGALDIVVFEELLGEDGPGLAYGLIFAGRSTTATDGWVLVNERQNTILADRAERIAAVTAEISLVRLRRALRKTLRGLPPESVWTAALRRDMPSVRLAADEKVVFPAVSDSVLSDSESLACRLIREQGGATTLRVLQRLFVANGMSAGSAGVVTSRSPVVERLSRGVLGVVGGSVESAKLADVRRLLKKDSARSLSGYRLVGGDVELLYKLDPALVSSTTFVLPRVDLPLGEWQLVGHGGRVVVKKSYILGLHRIAKLCLEQGSRRMTVRLSPSSRTVQVVGR